MDTKGKPTPKNGDLRVWWIPQVPMQAFYVPVADLKSARLVLDTLARYDLFQLENNIKPDFCNAGGLSIFESDSVEPGFDGWCDWCDAETGESFDEFCESHPESALAAPPHCATCDDTGRISSDIPCNCSAAFPMAETSFGNSDRDDVGDGVRSV